MRVFLPLISLVLLLAACGVDYRGLLPEFPARITIATEGAAENVALVAYRDGDAAWRRAEADGSDYAFFVTDEEGRYGFAFVCSVGDTSWGGGIEPTLFEATVEERVEWSLSCPEPGDGTPEDPPTGAITATLTGFDADADLLGVHAGPEQARGVPTGASEEYVLQPLRHGLYDLVAFEAREELGAELEQLLVERMAIRRGVGVGGPTAVAVDLAEDGFDLETHDLTVTGGLPGEAFQAIVGFASERGTLTTAHARYDTAPADPAIVPIRTVPSSRLESGEFHRVRVAVASPFVGDGDATFDRTVERRVRDGSDLSIALPERLIAGVELADTAPYLRYEANWEETDTASLFLRIHEVVISGEEAERHRWTVVLTRERLREGTYTLPDLSGVEGWNAAWTPPVDDVVFTVWGVQARSDNPAAGSPEAPLGEWEEWTSFTRGRIVFDTAFD